MRLLMGVLLVLVGFACVDIVSAQGKKVKAPEIVKDYTFMMGDPAEGPCKMTGPFALPAPEAISLTNIRVKMPPEKILVFRVMNCPASWMGARGESQSP